MKERKNSNSPSERIEHCQLQRERSWKRFQNSIHLRHIELNEVVSPSYRFYKLISSSFLDDMRKTCFIHCQLSKHTGERERETSGNCSCWHTSRAKKLSRRCIYLLARERASAYRRHSFSTASLKRIFSFFLFCLFSLSVLRFQSSAVPSSSPHSTSFAFSCLS